MLVNKGPLIEYLAIKSY